MYVCARLCVAMWSGAAADCVNGVLLTWLRDLRGLGAGKGKGMEGGQDGGGGGPVQLVVVVTATEACPGRMLSCLRERK